MGRHQPADRGEPAAVQESLLPDPEPASPVTFVPPLPGPRRYTTADSPLGPLLLIGDGEALTGLYMRASPPEPEWIADPGVFTAATRQLAGYFAGELTEFELALAPSGTGFQLAVWRALTTVPYGRTVSYSHIAHQVGQPTAVRAVGMTNGRNPISIVVPCHRVIGANGSLTGYGGGLDNKRFLLSLERNAAVGTGS